MKARRRLRTALEDMSSVPVPLHPCLRDIWHDHVLYTEDHVTGIVDLSAARTENVAADLARLLGSLLGPGDGRWELALESSPATSATPVLSCHLPVRGRDSKETAGASREEGGDDVKSACLLQPGLHTCYNG